MSWRRLITYNSSAVACLLHCRVGALEFPAAKHCQVIHLTAASVPGAGLLAGC